jgi:hypothetical protein
MKGFLDTLYQSFACHASDWRRTGAFAISQSILACQACRQHNNIGEGCLHVLLHSKRHMYQLYQLQRFSFAATYKQFDFSDESYGVSTCNPFTLPECPSRAVPCFEAMLLSSMAMCTAPTRDTQYHLFSDQHQRLYKGELLVLDEVAASAPALSQLPELPWLLFAALAAAVPSYISSSTGLARPLTPQLSTRDFSSRHIRVALCPDCHMYTRAMTCSAEGSSRATNVSVAAFLAQQWQQQG